MTKLTPRALRARWAVARLYRAAGRRGEPRREPVRAMGLAFPTPIGLAAGFDRRGRLLDRAHRLGLGAVEVGTVAAGARAIVRPRAPCTGAVRCGISLGKPAGVAWTQAEGAFVQALGTLHAAADYVTLNPGRDCPSAARFADVVAAVAQARDRLVRPGARPLPIVAKLPSRWLGEAAVGVAAAFVAAGADGLLVSAEGVASGRDAEACLARLSAAFGPRLCLVSVGGIASVRDVDARLRAGATLVQVHRALLGHDPKLLRTRCGPRRSIRR